MENNKVNAQSVAPPVLQYTTESTITVDGQEYDVTTVENTGVAPVWFIYVYHAKTTERVKFSGLFRQFGFGAKLTVFGDAIVSPTNFDKPTLAGLIAGAIAYDNAEYAEYIRYELS